MRVGIIGCGGIAGMHIAAYKGIDGVEIAAATDVDLERAVKVAGKAHAYTDVNQMLSSEKLDGVSVCTPPKFHKDVVCTALNAGVHVLCEKPLAMNAKEGREMVECAQKAGKLLITAFCHRFHEPVVKARQMIQTGKIGKVVAFRNRFGGRADMTQVWFSNPDISGGGTIPDTSVHSIDLFRYLVGDPVKVAGYIETTDRRYKVEDASTIMLQTTDGAMGTIEASWSTPGSANVIEIYGTDGAIVIDYTLPHLKVMEAGKNEWQEIPNENPDRFRDQAKHFVDCVTNGSKPIVDGTDGLRAMEIIDAVYAFARK